MAEILNLAIFVLTLYQFMILGVVILSWINPDPYNPIVRFLRRATDPVLQPFRRLMMPLTMQIRIDLSPILVFLIIGFVQRILRQIQYRGFDAAILSRAAVDGVLIFISSVFLFLSIFMIARTVVEWTHADRFNPIVRFIIMVTDPLTYRFRNFQGQNTRYNMAPAAGALIFIAGYAIIFTLRGLVWS